MDEDKDMHEDGASVGDDLPDDEDELDLADYEEVDFGDDDAPPPEEDDEEDGPGINFDDLELEKDQAIATFEGHSDSVYCVAVTTDGTRCVSGGGDDVAFLWDAKTGQAVAKLEGHKDSVVDCGFNCDNTLCATASYDGTLKIWSSVDGKLAITLEGPSSEVEWCQWHPNHNHVILAGSSDTTSWIWDTNNGACLAVLAGHEAPVTCGSFTSNGRRVVTGSLDSSVKLWDPQNSTCLHTFKGGNDWHQYGVCSVVCHPTEPMIAAGGQDGTIRVARLDSKKVIASFKHDGSQQNQHQQASSSSSSSSNNMEQQGEGTETCSVETVDFSDAHPYLVSGGTDGIVKVWDLTTQSCRHVCKYRDDEGESIVKVKCVPQSLLFVSCSRYGTSVLWDSRSGQKVGLLTQHRDMALDFAFAQQTFVSCSDDKTCRVVVIN